METERDEFGLVVVPDPCVNCPRGREVCGIFRCVRGAGFTNPCERRQELEDYVRYLSARIDRKLA